MSDVQRALLATFLPLTIFFVVFDQVYPEVPLMRFIKFTTVVALFLAALSIKKEFKEQKIMTLALLFAVFGDFFLGFGAGIPPLNKLHMYLGMLAFMLAYLTLSAAFHKRFKFGVGEAVALFPVLVVFIPVFFRLSAFLSGPLFYGTILFGLVLCYMAWSGICTVTRGYYSAKVSRLLALAGYLIFLSDLAVAFALFDPAFNGRFVPTLENLIWATFIPAWTLIVMAIGEKNLLLPSTQPVDTTMSQAGSM